MRRLEVHAEKGRCQARCRGDADGCEAKHVHVGFVARLAGGTHFHAGQLCHNPVNVGARLDDGPVREVGPLGARNLQPVANARRPVKQVRSTAFDA